MVAVEEYIRRAHWFAYLARWRNEVPGLVEKFNRVDWHLARRDVFFIRQQARSWQHTADIAYKQLYLQMKSVDHVLKSSYFMGERLAVIHPLLVPRPDTGDWLAQVPKHVSLVDSVLDIGCGTGCIVRSASRLFPAARRIVGVDVSFKAVSISRFNCRDDGRVSIKRLDLLKETVDESFDLVISNPPYITDCRSLAFGVRRSEDCRALMVCDRMLFYRRIIDLSLAKVLALELDGSDSHFQAVCAYASASYPRNIALLDSMSRKRAVMLFRNGS